MDRVETSFEGPLKQLSEYAGRVFYKDEEVLSFLEYAEGIGIVKELEKLSKSFFEARLSIVVGDNNQILGELAKGFFGNYLKGKDHPPQESDLSIGVTLLIRYSKMMLMNFLRNNYLFHPGIMIQLISELKIHVDIHGQYDWVDVENELGIKSLLAFETDFRERSDKGTDILTDATNEAKLKRKPTKVTWVDSFPKLEKLAGILSDKVKWILDSSQFVDFFHPDKTLLGYLECYSSHKKKIGLLIACLLNADYLGLENGKAYWKVVELVFVDECNIRLEKNWSDLVYKIRHARKPDIRLIGCVIDVLEEIGIEKQEFCEFFGENWARIERELKEG